MENRSHVGAQSFRRRRMVLSSTLMALFLFTVDATCSVGTTTVPSIRHHYTLGNRRQRQTAAPGREGLQVPRQHDTRNSRITKLQLVLNQLRCGAAALRSSEVTVTSTTSGDQETKGVVASSSSIPTQVSRTTTTAASETTTATPGSHGSAPVTTIKSSVSTTSSLRTIYAVSFLIFLSSSLVALSPVQALQQRLDASRATQVLSALSATAALMEITTSGMVGSLLDVTGRKPALTTIVGTLVLLNTCTALVPNVLTICLQRLVGMLSIGFFFLTSQTILSDIVVQGMAAAAPGTNPSGRSTSSSSSLVSAAMGQQMALTGLGFLLGILGAVKSRSLDYPSSIRLRPAWEWSLCS
jgi:hypothetical protein